MELFKALQTVIHERRSVKPGDMNGKRINDALIMALLELADWAPTHARTEPWRFVVFADDAKKTFCLGHAELYKANTDAEKFNQGKYEKLKEQGDPVSHIIIVYMKRTVQHSIPAVEEIAAAAAATENFLLGAQSLGIAALWSTGGMAHHKAMKEYLSLGEDDQVLGMLMLGYTDKEPSPGKRNIPLAEKIRWK